MHGCKWTINSPRTRRNKGRPSYAHFEALCSSLQSSLLSSGSSSALTSLDLTCCGLDDHSASVLAGSVLSRRSGPPLRSVCVLRNNFGEDGLRAIVGAAVASPELSTI